jgi:hypothetical protein
MFVHIYMSDMNKLYLSPFTVFRLLTDFVCLYNYEFWLSLCKIVRSSVILLLPLFTKTDIIIVLVGLLLLMIFLHILTQPCSGCYLFIFWHRFIISVMKVCYYQTVGKVASLPSCGHWSQCQINLWVHFHVRLTEM